MVLKLINNVQIYNLIKVAAVTSIATVTMGFIARNKISDNVKKTEFFKEAMVNLRKHKGAVSLLGEPIKDLTIQIGDLSKNLITDTKAQYEVPLNGSKTNGKLYLWAERENTESSWIVSRIELELHNEPYRRLLIKGTHNHKELEQS